MGDACYSRAVGAAGIPDIERTWARGPLHSAPQHYLTCCREGGASRASFQKWGALSSRGVLPSPLHVESRCRVCSVLINFAFPNHFRFAESLQRAACPSARAPPARTPLPGCVRRGSEADSGPAIGSAADFVWISPVFPLTAPRPPGPAARAACGVRCGAGLTPPSSAPCHVASTPALGPGGE